MIYIVLNWLLVGFFFTKTNTTIIQSISLNIKHWSERVDLYPVNVLYRRHPTRDSCQNYWSPPSPLPTPPKRWHIDYKCAISQQNVYPPTGLKYQPDMLCCCITFQKGMTSSCLFQTLPWAQFGWSRSILGTRGHHLEDDQTTWWTVGPPGTRPDR